MIDIPWLGAGAGLFALAPAIYNQETSRSQVRPASAKARYARPVARCDLDLADERSSGVLYSPVFVSVSSNGSGLEPVRGY
jgi:hypothetical protein